MDATMLARGLPLSLWGIWWNAILLLRPAFSRLRTFMWFVTAVAGLTVRVDLLGVTSIVRALNLRPRLYTKLLDHFHSSSINLDRLSALWTQAVLQMFPHLVRVNGRLVLGGDGIKAPKRGKKMPPVKLLHQQSESNTKPEYIMGHSMQAVGLLVHAAKSVFCVPLAVRIHEGLVWSNRDKRTLLDKMLGLIDILALKAPFYFVADAYYAAGKMARGLLKQGNHLVTRVKSNAVAYAPATPKKGKKTRGRPKTYGKKKKLKSLFDDPKSMQQIASPVYGERNVTLSYRVCDMLWRPVGLLVRFVAVIHPTRQGCSRLFVVVHIAEGFEASEGSGVAILGDGVGLIEPQDIISEAAQSGEDARVAADARGIFAEGDVAGVVLFVFDTPMFANGIGGLAGTDGAIGQVERGFA